MPRRAKILLALVTFWQVSCLAVLLIYRPTFGRVVVAGYTFWFGDIQATAGAFARVATYFAIVIVTAPVTALTLVLADFLSRRQRNWRRTVVTFLAWEAAVSLALVWSYEAGFPYQVNQLTWAVFGPPDDLYGFYNFVLPRAIAWVVCTTPPACIALMLHQPEKRTD